MNPRQWFYAYVGAGLLLIGAVVWVDRTGAVPFQGSAVEHADRSASRFHK